MVDSLTRPLISIVFLIFTCTLNAQVGKIIDQRSLLREFDNITDNLIKTHPALYRFVTVDSLDQLIINARDKITGPMDQLSFYKLVCPLFASIGDGHTKVLLGEDLFEKIHSEKGIFPYSVWMDDNDKMYIVDTELENPSIPLGSEIIGINGTPLNLIIKDVAKYVGYEHKSYRNSVISDNLSWLMALTQEYEKTLEIEINENDPVKINVDLIPFKKWKRKVRKKNKKSLKRLLEIENNEYRVLGDHIGYLKIHEFGSYNIGKYIDNIERIFMLINNQNIKSLIIDLRDNSGGDPRYVEALVHTISDIPFCRTEMMYQLKKGKPNSYYRLLGGPQDEIVSFAANHMVFSGNHEAHREPITFDNEFDGNIYVLVNEKSYSAAATLASVIKCYDLGIIIGNMTGGTRIFQAYTVSKTYPRSKVSSLVSSTMIYTSCSGFEDEYGYREGIIPDVVVEPTLEDKLKKRDVQLEYVIEKINEGGIQKTYD